MIIKTILGKPPKLVNTTYLLIAKMKSTPLSYNKSVELEPSNTKNRSINT